MTTQNVTDEQLGELSKILGDLFLCVCAGGVDFTEAMVGLQRLAENKSEEVSNPNKNEIVRWQKFYKKIFGERVVFSNIRIPERPGLNWWLVILAKGMTPEWLFNGCRKKFGARKWTDDDLDEIVISDRTAKDGHYAVWVRSNIEADEGSKNIHINQLKKQDHKNITFEEGFVSELFYIWKTKKRSGIKGVIRCSGSRYSDGGTPSVRWHNDEICVSWYVISSVRGGPRSHQVVSSTPET